MSKFPPLVKLLFNVVHRGIIPRTQKRNEANLFDSALIYCLGNQIQINFPSLMIKNLDHCIPNLIVGYGNLLTTVFESFDVDLSCYSSFELGVSHVIQDTTLSAWQLKVVNGTTYSLKDDQVPDVQDTTFC